MHPHSTIPPLLCACGCGQIPKTGNRYINGHNGHKSLSGMSPHLCACGCGTPIGRKSTYASNHFPRKKVPTAERFWAKVDVRGPDDCWPWLACNNEGGYGAFRVNGKTIGSNRVAYELTYGPLPEGKYACHSCDLRYPPGDISYRRCCNPAHLWAGTTQENFADMASKGRSALGKRNGSCTHPERFPWGDKHYTRRPGFVSSCRGEGSPHSKLTAEDVMAMRQAHADGMSVRQLSFRYHISGGVAWRIIHRQSWKHVA